MAIDLRFNCPSCGTKFAPVSGMELATGVYKRTCRKCRETWQIVVTPHRWTDDIKMHKGAFTFISRKKGYEATIS
jgi:hypothetical protein